MTDQEDQIAYLFHNQCDTMLPQPLLAELCGALEPPNMFVCKHEYFGDNPLSLRTSQEIFVFLSCSFLEETWKQTTKRATIQQVRDSFTAKSQPETPLHLSYRISNLQLLL